ncbi:porin [Salipiger bermudensis]|uniref:porin n=1 Tax=Salipiger bermudensis TaxID=344736 RepID=UPI003517C10E
MKNVLFATTALIATAGIASAEVSLSGSAEMGIIGGDQGIGYDAAGDTTNFADQFHTDIDVTFTLSGESDNGITFGATIDLDEEGGFANTNGGPEAVFISGDFGTLTMGDTDGALDKAIEGTDKIGDIADAATTFSASDAGIDGGFDGQVARYDYSVAGYDFGAGFQGGEFQESWGLSAGTTVGPVDLTSNYMETATLTMGGVDPVETQFGLAAVYTMDALSAGVMYREAHVDGVYTDRGWGVAANYDLGGGLTLMAGAGEGYTDNIGVSTDEAGTAYSFGLSMSF